jgi:hypothetical protein
LRAGAASACAHAGKRHKTRDFKPAAATAERLRRIPATLR